MMIYKYRMLSEGNDEFLREYELKASSTFLEFHQLIQDTVKFNGNELASFFICDGEWNRRTEVTLLDMEEEGENIAPDIPVMSKALLMEYMEEPRQRLIYEYDFLKPKTFYIELKGIIKDEDDVDYPRCTFSVAEPEPPKPTEDEEDVEEEEGGIEITEIEKLLRDLGGDLEEGPDEDYRD